MNPKSVSGLIDSLNLDVSGPKMNKNALPGLLESIKLGDDSVASWLATAAAAAAARASGKPQLPPQDNTDNESDESDESDFILDDIREDSDKDADISKLESRQWRKRVLLKIRNQRPKKNKARGDSRRRRRQTDEMLACRANQVIPIRPAMEPVPSAPEAELKPYYAELAHLRLSPDEVRSTANLMHYYDTHVKPLSESLDDAV